MAQYRQIGDEFFIGPQPTEQDLSEAKQQGIRTVIDFRMPAETANSNEQLTKGKGLDYVSVPVNKGALSEQRIGELEEAMRRHEGPYLVHCATGMRAAMLLALSRAKQNGWSAERTFQEAESMGYNLQSNADFAAFVRHVTNQ